MVDGFVIGFCLDGIASWASWACMTFDFLSLAKERHGWVDASFIICSVMDLDLDLERGLVNCVGFGIEMTGLDGCHRP
jgi:hypothetical protein